MHWNARTYLRLFLLVGGVGLLVLGVVNEDVLNVGIGAVAAVLGGGGLAYEWRETSE